jgi:hypothetical protein
MSDAVVDVENVVKTYETLLRLSTLADKYNELINTYKDTISKEVEIRVPQLGTIFVEPARFKELKPLPVPVCIETDSEFNAVYFGKRICIRRVDAFTSDIRCYSSKITVAELMELACNIGDVLEKMANDLEHYVNVLPKIIDALKTIVAETKLLS